MGDRPDYYTSMVMHGFDDPLYRAVAVDEHGNIQALLRGMFGTLVKTIAVDSDGVMKANLVAQELERAIFRLSYGQAERKSHNAVVGTLTKKKVFEIEGKGIIYGGAVRALGTASHQNNTLEIVVDEKTILSEYISSLNSMRAIFPHSSPIYITGYDTIWDDYAFCFSPGITFDSKFVFYYNNTDPTYGITVDGDIVFAKS